MTITSEILMHYHSITITFAITTALFQVNYKETSFIALQLHVLWKNNTMQYSSFHIFNSSTPGF